MSSTEHDPKAELTAWASMFIDDHKLDDSIREPLTAMLLDAAHLELGDTMDVFDDDESVSVEAPTTIPHWYDPAPAPEPTFAPPPSRLERLSRERERIGPVNLRAEQESEDLPMASRHLLSIHGEAYHPLGAVEHRHRVGVRILGGQLKRRFHTGNEPCLAFVES